MTASAMPTVIGGGDCLPGTVTVESTLRSLSTTKKAFFSLVSERMYQEKFAPSPVASTLSFTVFMTVAMFVATYGPALAEEIDGV